MGDSTASDTDSRAELERRANLLRSRFLRRLDTLDQRGHELVHAATEMRKQAERALPLALAVVGAATLVGAVVYVSGRRRRQKPTALWERLLEPPPPPPSPWRAALKSAARALAVRALQAAAQHAVSRLADASPRALNASR
ncbi:MAG: hypothetical protein QM756_08315 [Polyangiaceae bacterium]